MVNQQLKNTMLEAVDNQLRDDEPKCTKESYERLIAAGYSDKEAREMIAAILIEEMYDVLKYKREFNQEKYALKLGELGTKKVLDTRGDANSDASIKVIFDQIAYNNGYFPRKELETLISRKEEAIPILLNVLKEVRDKPKEYVEQHDYFGHIYAVYLLAQFRVAELYPIFIDILRLPHEMPHDLFGDTICESAAEILASVCEEDIQPLKDLAENSEADEYVRGQALKALCILVLHDKLERESVLEYYRYLLNGGLKDGDPHVMASVVSCCNDLYPEEVMSDIERVFEEDRLEGGIISIDFINKTLKSSKEDALAYFRADHHLQFINDAIAELEGCACFYKEKRKISHKPKQDRSIKNIYASINNQTIIKGAKIGRNEPCPCGSGKKYKKCCGK